MGNRPCAPDCFLRWFNQYNKQGHFYIQTAEIKHGKTTDYVALIIQRSHPAFDDIVELFDSEIMIFKSNKADEDQTPESPQETPQPHHGKKPWK